MLRTLRIAATVSLLVGGLAACEKEVPPTDRVVTGQGGHVAKAVDDHADHGHAPGGVGAGADYVEPPPATPRVAAQDPRLPRTYAPADVTAEAGTVAKRPPLGGGGAALGGQAAAPDLEAANDPSGCAALGPKFEEIGRAEMAKAIPDEAQRAQLEPQVAMMRQQFVSMCRQENWSKAAKQCIEKIDPAEGFGPCEDLIIKSRADHAQAEAQQELKGADPKKVAACKPVAKKLAGLAKQQMTQTAQTERDKKLAQQILGPMELQLTAQCATQDWSKEARDCLVKAKTMADTAPCQAMLPGGPGGPGGGGGHHPGDGHGH